MGMGPLAAGLKRHWKQVPGWLFSVFLSIWGAIWLVSNSSGFYLPKFNAFIAAHTEEIMYLSIASALVYCLWRLWEPQEVTFPIANTRVSIKIRFGDLFGAADHIVIPANEFFDTDLGDPVNERSVHGQLIAKVFGGNSTQFRTAVDTSLQSDGAPYTQVAKKVAPARDRKYPIGTTATVQMGTKCYFLFALTTTDLGTNKASADVPQLWQALDGLWNTVCARAGGGRVHIPVVGGGLARINLKTSQLVRLLILSIVEAAMTKSLTCPVEIVVLPREFADVDLKAIAAEWT